MSVSNKCIFQTVCFCIRQMSESASGIRQTDKCLSLCQKNVCLSLMSVSVWNKCLFLYQTSVWVCLKDQTVGIKQLVRQLTCTVSEYKQLPIFHCTRSSLEKAIRESKQNSLKTTAQTGKYEPMECWIQGCKGQDSRVKTKPSPVPAILVQSNCNSFPKIRRKQSSANGSKGHRFVPWGCRGRNTKGRIREASVVGGGDARCQEFYYFGQPSLN